MLFGKSKLRDVVSVVVESTDLRYLSTKGGEVDNWGSVVLEPGLVSDGVITDAIEMGPAFDTLFSEQKLDRKHVMVGISGLRAIPRMLTLPRLQASVLRDTISREARREMPVSLENLHLSWQMMPPEGDMQRIYLLGVPKETIESHVRTLEVANIKPWVMDLKPLCLVRAVKQEEAIIVNLERDSLDIVLVVDNLPAIMRSFSLQQANMDDQIKLDRLVNELLQTVRFYNDSHARSPIQPATSVYVTGRLLSRAEVVDYLTGVIDRPIERPAMPLPCPEDMPMMEYMTNLGLALKKL